MIARGDTVILRDPERGDADVVARGQMAYNVETRRGSVTNISTSVETGQTWYVSGTEAAFQQVLSARDTSSGRETIFYARDGIITSCDDPIPDYHFKAKQIKMVSKNIMVARPAVLYIGDVPVMWLPFIFRTCAPGGAAECSLRGSASASCCAPAPPTGGTSTTSLYFALAIHGRAVRTRLAQRRPGRR